MIYTTLTPLFAVFVCLFVRRYVRADPLGLSLLRSTDKQRMFNQTYPGCWLGNRFYMVGDKWSPEIEPYGVMQCVKCQCAQVVKRNIVQLDGKVLCRNIKPDCPKVTCSEPRLRPNTCCKICSKHDSAFEDQFSHADVGNVPVLSTELGTSKHIELNALLTGSTSQTNQPIRTRAVAIVRIHRITGKGFRYHIRFSRLRRAVSVRVLDQSGGTLMEVALTSGSKRRGMVHGEIRDIPHQIMAAILNEKVTCVITTNRHKDGEIAGPLLIDRISTPAQFEALLSPNFRRGYGGHMTLRYDSVTSQMSYVIRLQNYDIVSTGPSFYVTIEKDTEIVYQHLLRLSDIDTTLVGTLNVDRKISKQISRGRLTGRVTSRSGEVITGVIRPRLVRSDLLSIVSLNTHNISGYIVCQLQENGALAYKVFLQGHEGVYAITIQRLKEHKHSWANIVKVKGRVKPTTRETMLTGQYKKLKVKDVAAILDGQVRIRLVLDRKTSYQVFNRIAPVNIGLLKDSSMVVHNSVCGENIVVWYKMTRDCTLHLFVKHTGEKWNKPGSLTGTLETRTGRAYDEMAMDFHFTKKNPEVHLVNLSDTVLTDLNAGRAYLHINQDGTICDTWKTALQVKNNCWKGSTPEKDKFLSEINENELDSTDKDLIERCYHEDKFYTHGDTWVPQRSEACVTCRCEGGTVYCDDVLCPPTPCTRPVKRKGECCSVCDDNNETEQKPRGSCFYPGDKRWHSFGTSWHPYVPPFGYSKCSICTCVETSGDVNCTRLTCPELQCPVYQRIRVNKNDCCQTCSNQFDNKRIAAPTTKFTDDCKIGTKEYKHGDKWHPTLTPFGEMTCYVCSCKNSKIKCRKKKCPVLQCKNQYRPAGQCCPVCFGQTKSKLSSRRKRLRGI